MSFRKKKFQHHPREDKSDCLWFSILLWTIWLCKATWRIVKIISEMIRQVWNNAHLFKRPCKKKSGCTVLHPFLMGFRKVSESRQIISWICYPNKRKFHFLFLLGSSLQIVKINLHTDTENYIFSPHHRVGKDNMRSLLLLTSGRRCQV